MHLREQPGVLSDAGTNVKEWFQGNDKVDATCAVNAVKMASVWHQERQFLKDFSMGPMRLL